MSGVLMINLQKSSKPTNGMTLTILSISGETSLCLLDLTFNTDSYEKLSHIASSSQIWI